MSAEYPVFQLQPDIEEALEQMGSKEKFWLRWARPGDDEAYWLFKYSREGTGEHWAEKLGAEIAAVLGIPHAEVELAECGGRPGCLLRSFIPVSPPTALIHGNEVLAAVATDYRRERTFGHSQHTFERIAQAFLMLFDGEGLGPALAQLASYLVLDALILNTDRHHENWGLLLGGAPGQPKLRLAPTYDHASSLGRELTPARRAELLQATRVPAYANSPKARGGIYLREEDAHGAHPVGLVEALAPANAGIFAAVLSRLQGVSPADFQTVIGRVPENVMSADAKSVARIILDTSCERLRQISL